MSKFAVALDIGTTNISCALIDASKKRIVSTLDRPNEQITHGDDIISRLKFATCKNGIEELNKKLIDSIRVTIDLLITQANIDKRDIIKILAVGNAAMYHLSFLLPVETLACAPFAPFETKLIRRRVKDVGLRGFSESEFIFLPNIGGFVGSDAIGVIVAVDMHKREETRLAIDLGTNGEVILGNNKKILVASTAAGPAFEGWHISCGSRPVRGAIIYFGMAKNRVTLRTIEDLPPNGIASSGLINIISTLIHEGYVDKTGRLTPEEFVVYKTGEKKIYINQKDVREIQLAKSAIQTAINLMISNYGIDGKDVDEIIITGKFGGSLNKEDLIRIGLIPYSLKEKRFSFAENLALKGASIILAEDRMDEVDSILKITKHIELHKEKDFQEEFAKGLHFEIP